MEDGSKMGPGWTEDVPRWGQDAAKKGQNGPEQVNFGPKMAAGNEAMPPRLRISARFETEDAKINRYRQMGQKMMRTSTNLHGRDRVTWGKMGPQWVGRSGLWSKNGGQK